MADERTPTACPSYLGVKNCPVHHAAAENDPLGRDNENQACAQAGQRVGSRLPDGVLVRDVGQVFPFAVLWVVGTATAIGQRITSHPLSTRQDDFNHQHYWCATAD